MPERRISLRITSSLAFWIWPCTGDAPSAIPAELGDISASGIYFWAEEPLAMAAPLRMVLSLQMGRPQSAPVVVVVSGKVIRLDTARADGHHGVAASVERYHVLEPGATLHNNLQHLVAL
jgi:hypothetical protein